MAAHQVTALCYQNLGSDASPEQDRGVGGLLCVTCKSLWLLIGACVSV